MTIVRHPEIPSGSFGRFRKSRRPQGNPGPGITRRKQEMSCSHRLDLGVPDPHTRQEVVASSVTPAFGEPAETKKALLRRCFKSRPPLEKRLRPGFSPVTGRPGGGFPPTGTRPQARAKLGKRDLGRTDPRCKGKSPIRRFFLDRRIARHAPLSGQPHRDRDGSRLAGKGSGRQGPGSPSRSHACIRSTAAVGGCIGLL